MPGSKVAFSMFLGLLERNHYFRPRWTPKNTPQQPVAHSSGALAGVARGTLERPKSSDSARGVSRNVDLGTFVKRAFAGISKAFASAKVVVSRWECREKELGRVGPKTADPQGDRDPFSGHSSRGIATSGKFEVS